MAIKIWRLFILGSLVLLGCVEGLAQSLTIGSTATLSLNNAELVVSGETENGGTLEIENITTLVSDLTNLGILDLDLHSSTTPGSGYDQIVVTGNTVLGGTLDIFLDTGYLPDIGDIFTIVTCGSGCVGTFGALNLPDGQQFLVHYGANDVRLEYLGDTLPPFPDGQFKVKLHQKISDTEGGFTGILDNEDHFGEAIAHIGDLDGDQVSDLAVGVPGDDDGAGSAGALWIVFLNADGTVKGHQKVSNWEGGFSGGLQADDNFGFPGAIGDLDGDGVSDLAVGAPDDGNDRGAVWILFMNTNGTVKSYQKITENMGGFTGDLNTNDFFGRSVTSLGDLDSDGVTDLAIGAPGDLSGCACAGTVWILFMNTNGTVKSHQRISDNTVPLSYDDHFGQAVAGIDDFDGDGIPDVAVGAVGDDDGGTNRGAIWLLFLNSDGTVKTHQKISSLEGGFTGGLSNRDFFGSSLASMGDLNGDGNIDLAAGANKDDDGGRNRGAAWVLLLNSNGTVKAHQKISSLDGGFTGGLSDSDLFGHSLAGIGDLDGDGKPDLAIGSKLDDDGGSNRGAVWILFLEPDSLNGSSQLSAVRTIPHVEGLAMQVDDSFVKNSLSSAYPNPFNPSTTITYSLSDRQHVTLEVYDTLGRKIKTLVDGVQVAGLHQVIFDARGLPSGIYFYSMRAGSFVDSKKLILTK